MKPTEYGPISPKFPHMLHGGDYNPDQWIQTPEIWDEDMRLMKLSGCNAMSVCIFSWSALEPAEGRFEFGWLDTIMDKLAKNHAYAVMATPSGSKPAWMSRAYPEIRRVKADGVRQPHWQRHNHCRTSPVYRDKCVIINTKLASATRATRPFLSGTFRTNTMAATASASSVSMRSTRGCASATTTISPS